MDRLERLLRDANPVPDNTAPPESPLPDFRRMLVLRETGSAVTSDALPAVKAGNPFGRLLPAIAGAALAVLIAAAAVFALIFLPAREPAPVATEPTGDALAGDWRIAGFVTDPESRPETQVQFRLPPGWNLTRSGHDPDTPDPEFPAVTAYLFLPSTSAGAPMDSTKAAAMAYYGPIGGKYDPADCPGKGETYTELDSSRVSIPFEQGLPGAVPPRFVYRVTGASDGTLIPSFGITTQPPGNSTGPCIQYFQVRAERPGHYFILSSRSVFSSATPGWLVDAPNPVWPTFSSVREAQAFMATEDYRNLKRLIMSVTITAP